MVIPTYEAGTPEKNPMFLEKRVYQGSSGAVYPYPVIESVSDRKEDKSYRAIFLENEYIKVMVLPELGGRIQMAYDKIKQRHFIYYNHVIKPALVGLAGPWISGGIEFNWPQHHRPSTFLPVDATIEEHPDGSVTVWVNEMERMTHQKGMAGFTLRPGCAYLEIKGAVYNRTDMPQTFLWWANPAVAVNDAYQSVFPPDIHAVFDHGKRAVSSFPVATGTYYKMDYSAGVDISNYKNIKVPTSYMAVNSRFDFEGGYENDTRAGMLHVANHHVAPGKKQWTWGNGDFGRAWDRNLTDEDGPYIELMAGVYTENQPDFSWLQPYEEKQFTQYFLPYRELGIVKNATKDLLLNVEPAGTDQVRILLFATSHQTVEVTLREGTRALFQQTATLTPERLLDETVATGETAWEALRLEVRAGGKRLLDWQPEADVVTPLPDPARAAPEPEALKTNELLYLTGLHLEQYRHATYCAQDYYEEALRRDPDDIRCNNALGLWYLRRGRFQLAESYLQRAVRGLKRYNPNPYDGEPIYNLGLSLSYQRRYEAAYEQFYKACWNGAWQDAGYFACAQLSARQGLWERALDEVERALIRNSHNHKARALKTMLLRRTGDTEGALRFIEESLAIDPFNYGCLFERYLLRQTEADRHRLTTLLRQEPHNYDETALDYAAAGRWEEASALWALAEAEQAVTPMTYYYWGDCLAEAGQPGADERFAQAATLPADYCFPNRLEAVLALQRACALNPTDAKAPYYLGNLYYDKRQYTEAIRAWECAAERDDNFPTVWRNLALAYFNKQGDKERARCCMERAFRLDPGDARLLMELDQLDKRNGEPHATRLARLRRYPTLVARRDDLLLEAITLLNLTGHYQEAKERLDAHRFHPWEGGEGKVPAQYQFARVELAKEALRARHPEAALPLLQECLIYPPHLGEGKLYGAQENDFHYFLGCACETLGRQEEAVSYWEQAATGQTEPAAALYYNDAKPDKIFYQGLALLKLGRQGEANGRFHKLVNYGEKHLFDKVKIDYFAVSLPDLLIWEEDLDVRNRIHCLYMMALGHFGLGDQRHALRFLKEAEQLDPNHLGIRALHSLMTLYPLLQTVKPL